MQKIKELTVSQIMQHGTELAVTQAHAQGLISDNQFTNIVDYQADEDWQDAALLRYYMCGNKETVAKELTIFLQETDTLGNQYDWKTCFGGKILVGFYAKGAENKEFRPIFSSQILKEYALLRTELVG